MSLLSEALRPACAGVDAAGRMALAGLDALPRGDTRTRRSGGFWRARWWIAPSAALSGPLVDTVARDVTRYTLLERVVDELGRGDALEQALLRAEATDVPQR